MVQREFESQVSTLDCRFSDKEIGKLQKFPCVEIYGNNLRGAGSNLPEVDMLGVFSSGLECVYKLIWAAPITWLRLGLI